MRTALGTLADLELVGERLDDRDTEPAFREIVVGARVLARSRRLEALAVITDFDDEPICVELVEDLDRAVTVAVGVADGVRARLGQRQLQVAEHLLGKRHVAQARDARQGKPPEGDVFRLGRNGQRDRVYVTVAC